MDLTIYSAIQFLTHGRKPERPLPWFMTRFDAGRGLRSALAWTAAGCGAAQVHPACGRPVPQASGSESGGPGPQRVKPNTVELAVTHCAEGVSGSLSPRGRGLGVRGAGHDQSPCPKGRADWCDPSPYPLLQAWFKRRSQLKGAWGRRPKGDVPTSEAGALGAR